MIMNRFGDDLDSSDFRASETSSFKRLKTVSASETWKAIGAVKALLGLRHPGTIAGKLKKGSLEWRKSVKIATRFPEDLIHLLFYLFTDSERKALICAW